MSEFARLLILLSLAGAALTFMGSVVIWYMDEERRIRRALRNVLGAKPEAVLIARGRGRGTGFSFATGLAAVAWDSGAWCLVYRIDELIGAELLVDGVVAARAFRGEARRALDQTGGGAEQVTLRLIFDDPKDPDFDLDLWLTGDETRRKATPVQAVQEANRWMARSEAILRRPLPPQPTPEPQSAPVAEPAPSVAAIPAAAAAVAATAPPPPTPPPVAIEASEDEDDFDMPGELETYEDDEEEDDPYRRFT